MRAEGEESGDHDDQLVEAREDLAKRLERVAVIGRPISHGLRGEGAGSERPQRVTRSAMIRCASWNSFSSRACSRSGSAPLLLEWIALGLAAPFLRQGPKQFAPRRLAPRRQVRACSSLPFALSDPTWSGPLLPPCSNASGDRCLTNVGREGKRQDPRISERETAIVVAECQTADTVQTPGGDSQGPYTPSLNRE